MKIMRWIGIAVLASCVLMATLVALAPTLLSTSWGQGLCLKAASHVYEGPITLDSLSIGWLSGVDVHNLTVKDPQGRDFFSCKQVSLDRPLISLVFSQKDFGSIKVVSPQVYCYASKKSHPSSTKNESQKDESQVARTNSSEKKAKSEKSFEPSKNCAYPTATPDIKGHVSISDAKLVTLIDNTVAGTISQGEVSLDLDLLHSSKGTVSGILSQNSSNPTPLCATFFANGAPQLSNIQGSLSLSCNKVPTELLATLASSLHPDIAALLQESFGSSVSYSLSATMNGPAIAIHSTMTSDNLRSDINVKVENDIVTVDKGTLLTGTLSPRLFSLLVNQAAPPTGQPITLLTPSDCILENARPLCFRLSTEDFASPLDLQCSVKTPLSLSVGPNKPPVTIAAHASIQGEAANPSAAVDITASTVADTATFHLTATGARKNDGYKLSTVMDINGKWPCIAETLTGLPATTLLGQDCTCVVNADGLFHTKDDFSFHGTGRFSSQNIQKTATFSCTNTLFSLSQASIDAKIPPSLIDKTNPVIKQLIGPTGVHMTVAGNYDLKQSVGTVQIRIDGKQSFGPYSLSIPVAFDINRRTLTSEPVLSINSEQLIKGTSSVTLGENSDLPLMENLSAECCVELFHLPSSFLELFSPQPLSPIIGDTLSSKLCCTFHGLSAQGNSVSLSASGAFWKANLDLSLDAMRLSSRSGKNAVEAEATLSPKSFEALKSLIGLKSNVTIGDVVTVHFAVPQCNANLAPFVAENKKQPSLWEMLDALSISAKTSFSPLQLCQHETCIGRLSPLTATFDLQGKTHSLRFDVGTSGSADADAMSIAVKGVFDNIWNAKGLCLPCSHLRSSIQIDRFPTLLLDLALPGQGALLEEAIGKTVQIVGDVSADEMKSGSVKLDLQSKNCTLHLDGMIQDGKMTLKAPAKASLTLTKQAGTTLLKNVNPLLATAVHSEKPIQLTVVAEGTVIPLSPFAITGVCLPKVTADVGKIVVKNGGALKAILALLNMGQAANSDDLDVWLTPIYIRLQGGIVTCQRADALVANKIHMITWGDVDLGQDRLNMTIAIPQETLTALRMQIMTPTPERGLQIPITGSSANPKIDTNRATARLAGAAIVDNVPDKRLQIFGGLLQAAAASVGEPDKPIPPPTTHPFPWER